MVGYYGVNVGTICKLKLCGREGVPELLVPAFVDLGLNTGASTLKTWLEEGGVADWVMSWGKPAPIPALTVLCSIDPNTKVGAFKSNVAFCYCYFLPPLLLPFFFCWLDPFLCSLFFPWGPFPSFTSSLFFCCLAAFSSGVFFWRGYPLLFGPLVPETCLYIGAEDVAVLPSVCWLSFIFAGYIYLKLFNYCQS